MKTIHITRSPLSYRITVCDILGCKSISIELTQSELNRLAQELDKCRTDEPHSYKVKGYKIPEL